MSDITGSSVAPVVKALEPIRLGARMLKNRLVMLPHGTSMLENGAPTDDDIAYFETRARQGPGLIITGAAVTGPDSTPRGGKLVRPYDETALPALARRAEALRRHGATVIGQILHLGRETIGMEVDYVPVAPSPLRSPRDMMAPRELDETQIGEIVRGFARSAANLEATGHDGVEIHAAHGHLAAQFLSPATNLRHDAYGGSAEKRLRFLREVITAIRQSCGPDFILGVRLSGEEQITAGLTIDESASIADAIASAGGVSYLSVTAGVRGAYVKDASQAEGFAIEAARRLRQASGLPTIVGQRILRPEMIQRILADGAADMVGMARAFIAEPHYVDRLRTGRAVRPCIGVNQDCRAFAPHLHCAVNPQAGRERDASVDDGHAATARKSVAVIGGGPAGMEAAITAARRGHRVTLFERSDRLGGQMLAAASLPTRGELIRLVDFHLGELDRLGVEVRLNSGMVSADGIEGHDAVIVATGATARPLAHRFAGATTCAEILASGAPAPSGTGVATVVDDGIGFWWTYGVADFLAEAGWRLRIVTPSAAIAQGIPTESVAPLLARLGRAEPEFCPLTLVDALSDDGLVLRSLTGGPKRHLASDLVVIQTGRVSRPWRFRDSVPAPVVVGDALTPRRLSQAVLEGRRAGVAV